MWKGEVWEGLHVWRDEEGDTLEARRRTVVDGSQLFFLERERVWPRSETTVMLLHI